MQKSSKLHINQLLERTIADRTQGDDIVHSLKFSVSQTINTLENIIDDDFFPSFNVMSFLFTYLLEKTTAIYKQEVSQLLNLYLKRYYEQKLENSEDINKFLDMCVMNISNFKAKYATNESHMEKTDLRIELSIKHTLSSSHSNQKRTKHNRLNSVESDRSKILKQRKSQYNVIKADEKNCTDQFLKYFLLQESSSINNDQIDFLVTNHLDNYSLYLQGELLFYLNFYNHELPKRSIIKCHNNHIFTRMFNYLLYLEEDFVEFGIQVHRECIYAAFTLFMKFCSVRAHKDPVFLMHFFYPDYKGECTKDILKSIAKTVFLFVNDVIGFLKEIEFDAESHLTYWHDMVMDWAGICFVICFQFLRYMKNLPKYDFHEQFMASLIAKYFADTYELVRNSPSNIDTLFDFYVLEKIVNFKSNHYMADCKVIHDLRVYFVSHVKKHTLK